MKKSSFLKAIAGQFNQVRDVETLRIANVAFHHNPWKIVKWGTTWDEVADRSYIPLASFRTSRDLWEGIKSNLQA